ncbi:hypothetical protein [Niveibacterium sp.]|uniref:hypothetical protein n=1 Tax=Niveibacterium sp. TaxID=2017444 RepID=UPI0035AFE6D1
MVEPPPPNKRRPRRDAAFYDDPDYKAKLRRVALAGEVWRFANERRGDVWRKRVSCRAQTGLRLDHGLYGEDGRQSRAFLRLVRELLAVNGTAQLDDEAPTRS